MKRLLSMSTRASFIVWPEDANTHRTLARSRVVHAPTGFFTDSCISFGRRGMACSWRKVKQITNLALAGAARRGITPRWQRRRSGLTTVHYADLALRVDAARVGQSEHMAAGILWLGSDATSDSAGYRVVIDGGLSL